MICVVYELNAFMCVYDLRACMYVCICMICAYVCTYVCTYVCMYACIRV